MFSDVGLQPGNRFLLPWGEDFLPFNIQVSIYLLDYLSTLIVQVVPNWDLKYFLSPYKKKFSMVIRDERNDNDDF